MKKILLFLYIIYLPLYTKAQTPNRLYEVPELKVLFHISEPENTLDYPKFNYYPIEVQEPTILKSNGVKKYLFIKSEKNTLVDISFSEDNYTGKISIKESGKTKKLDLIKLNPDRFNQYLEKEKLISLLVGQTFWYKSNGLNLQWQVANNEIKELNIISSYRLDDDTSVIKVFVYSGNAKNRTKYYNGILNLYISVGTDFYINKIHCESFTRK